MSAVVAEAKKLKDQGNQFFAKKDYNKAIDLYSQAIDTCATEHTFFSNRSAAYLLRGNQGDARRAADDAQQCVDIEPKFAKGHHRLINALKELKEYQNALKACNKALDVLANDDHLIKVRNELKPLAEREEKQRRSGLSLGEKIQLEGNDLYKAANFEAAKERYTQALAELSDKSGEVALKCFNNRAACSQQLGDYRSVVRDCECVLEVEEKNLKALLRRALALEHLDKHRSALNDIRAYLAIDPTNEKANAAQHRIGTAVRRLRRDSAK